MAFKRIWSNRYINWPDFIISECIYTPKHHILPTNVCTYLSVEDKFLQRNKDYSGQCGAVDYAIACDACIYTWSAWFEFPLGFTFEPPYCQHWPACPSPHTAFVWAEPGTQWLTGRFPHVALCSTTCTQSRECHFDKQLRLITPRGCSHSYPFPGQY